LFFFICESAKDFAKKGVVSVRQQSGQSMQFNGFFASCFLQQSFFIFECIAIRILQVFVGVLPLAMYGI
jgi:hypothetical protein